MPADCIIVVADPVVSLLFDIGYRGPGAGVDEFFLIGREERFGHGIVVADTGPAQGSSYIILRTVGIEDRGCVLAAPVGMEDHPGGRIAGGDGHVEGGGDQAGAHVRGDRPADDGTGVQVEDGGEVRPAVPGPDAGRVTAPAGVRQRGGEVAADQVRRGDRMVAADGGPLPRLRVASLQASGLHEPVGARVGGHVPQSGQARAQAPPARVPPGQLVYLPHDRDEGAVVFLPLGQLRAPPRVVTGTGHAQLGAHERHRIGIRISPVRDGSKSYCLPFANQVATFFANSTCIRSSLIADLSSLVSARSRISSTRSDSPSRASGGIPDAAASRATFTHLPRVISWTPMLRATSATGRPPSRTKATDCSLYSGVNARRVEPISRSPDESGS